MIGCNRVESTYQTFNGSSAKMLPSTDNIKVSAETNFSISPNGQWLFYQSNTGNPFAPVYILYDLKTYQPYQVNLSLVTSTLAAEGRGPLEKKWVLAF